jgi:DNA (cytosine-5)-methyltransferase 1
VRDYKSASDLICFSAKDHGADAGDKAPTLRAGGHTGSHANARVMPAIAFNWMDNFSFKAEEEEQTNPLRKSQTEAVCIPILEAGARTGKSTTDVRAGSGIGETGDPMYTLQSGKQHAVAFGVSGCETPKVGININPNLRSERQGFVSYKSCVRRLTPIECERLQGFPDNYTLIPTGKKAADGPRYKALGNSMAVPVMRWIGERIQMVDDIRR